MKSSFGFYFLCLTAVSLTSLSVEERIKIAHNVYGSHVFDVLLSLPSINAKAKRTIIMDFIGSYHVLVDDRIGSHVVDRCWEYADTYLKVRYQSMIPGELITDRNFPGKNCEIINPSR